MATLTESEGPVTSSYIDSKGMLPSDLSDCSRAGLVFALLLRIIVIAVIETTALTSRVIAREMMDAMYTLLVSDLCILKFSVG